VTTLAPGCRRCRQPGASRCSAGPAKPDQPSSCSALPALAYAPPELTEIGGVYDRTLNGDFCLFGKQFGGSDGFMFMGIAVPISNCSQ
jgi:hypothetical protein